MAKEIIAFGDQLQEVRNQINIIRSSEYFTAHAAYAERMERASKLSKVVDPEEITRKLHEMAQEVGVCTCVIFVSSLFS